MNAMKLCIGITSVFVVGCHAMDQGGDKNMNLHEAVRLGRTAAVRQLLDAGASIDAQVPEYLSATPLHLAVYNGYTDIVQELIKRGANVNHQLDSVKATPLHIAAMKGRAHIARLLLQAGANVNANNKDNMTPLHSCAESGKLELIQFLKVVVPEQKPSRKATVLNLSQNLYVVTAEVLLDHGALLDANPIKGTPLHLAARHGNAELVSLLIRRGANLYTRRPISATPLHEAVVGSSVEIAKHPEKTPESLSLLRAFICTPSRSVMREGRAAAFPVLCCLARAHSAQLRNPIQQRIPWIAKDVRRLLWKYCLATILVDQQVKELKRLFELKMKFAASEFTPSQLASAQAGNGALPGLRALALYLDPHSVEQHRALIRAYLMKLVAQNQL